MAPRKCYLVGNGWLQVKLRFADRGLELSCTNPRKMQAKFGKDVAKNLQRRLAELSYVQQMSDLLEGPGRWEELTANRDGEWSARLTRNWRLIVRPVPGPPAAVLVVAVEDYH